MRIPTRKGEEERRLLASPEDRHFTLEAIERLKRQHERLITVDRPTTIVELQHAQQMGDLSENFGYQEAKRRLRAINSKILILEEKIATAIPIAKSADGTVGIGSTVVVETGGKRFTFEILGSHETDPTRGRISHLSPLGSILIGKRVGDTAVLKANDRETTYKIVDVT